MSGKWPDRELFDELMTHRGAELVHNSFKLELKEQESKLSTIKYMLLKDGTEPCKRVECKSSCTRFTKASGFVQPIGRVPLRPVFPSSKSSCSEKEPLKPQLCGNVPVMSLSSRYRRVRFWKALGLPQLLGRVPLMLFAEQSGMSSCSQLVTVL